MQSKARDAKQVTGQYFINIQQEQTLWETLMLIEFTDMLSKNKAFPAENSCWDYMAFFLNEVILLPNGKWCQHLPLYTMYTHARAHTRIWLWAKLLACVAVGGRKPVDTSFCGTWVGGCCDAMSCFFGPCLAAGAGLDGPSVCSIIALKFLKLWGRGSRPRVDFHQTI